MPPKFDHCVEAIEEVKYFSKMTVLELLSFWQAHEQRINRFSNQSLESRHSNPKLFFQKRKQVSGREIKMINKIREKKRFRKKGSNNKNTVSDIASYATQPQFKGLSFHKCTRGRIPNHSQTDWHQKKQEKEQANVSKEEIEDLLFYTWK